MQKARSGRGNLVPYMSADLRNKIINSIGNQLQKVIVGEINTAGMYNFFIIFFFYFFFYGILITHHRMKMNYNVFYN